MMGLEAEADRWLADAPEFRNSADLVIEATRGMLGMSPAAAAPFIKRQRQNVVNLVLQAYLEGFYNGGVSRAEYERQRK